MKRHRRGVCDSAIGSNQPPVSVVRSGNTSKHSFTNRKLLDSKEPIANRNTLFTEHESCMIDGFLFYSFATAEHQQTFARLSPSELTEIPRSIHPVVPNIAETKDILFINCGTSDLKKENKEMTRRGRITCNLCGQAFAFEFSLEFHLRNIIPKNSKKLFCEFCPHISLSGETMRMHNKHLHGKRLFDMYKGEDFLKELCGETVPACKPCF